MTLLHTWIRRLTAGLLTGLTTYGEAFSSAHWLEVYDER
jgi:hypothetical protein